MKTDFDSKIKELNAQIDSLREKIKKSYYSDDEKSSFFIEKNKLEEKLESIIDKKIVFSSLPTIKNNKISLYLKYNDSYHGEYYLILDNYTDTIVGNISYLGQENLFYGGNIGYHIKEEYRGNKFSLLALKLLADKLYQNGIQEILIATRKDNIASNIIAQRFGGIPTSYEDDSNINVYVCDLSQIKKG